MVDRLLLGHYAPAATPELGGPGSDAPLAADHTRPRITLYDTEQQRAETYRQTVAADLETALRPTIRENEQVELIRRTRLHELDAPTLERLLAQARR